MFIQSFVVLFFTESSVNATSDVFDKVWSKTHTVPFFLLLFIAPLINFKSPTFFTKFNALGNCFRLIHWFSSSFWGFILCVCLCACVCVCRGDWFMWTFYQLRLVESDWKMPPFANCFVLTIRLNLHIHMLGDLLIAVGLPVFSKRKDRECSTSWERGAFAIYTIRAVCITKKH